MQPETNPLAPGTAVGVTEEMIVNLVHSFYARVRKDDMLGPIFNRAIADWDEHLDKLCTFWSSVTLMTGRYKGTPMQAHAALPEVTGPHFDRWLAIFRDTAVDTCPSQAAALFIDRAERIADSLERGIAVYRGQFMKNDERLAPGSATV